MQNLQFNPYDYQGLFHDGSWQNSSTNNYLEVYNPCDGALVASVITANADDTKKAIDSAASGLAAYRKTNSWDRADLLNNIADIMLEHSDDAIQLLARELGKPFTQGQRDWELAIDQFRWFATEARQLGGDIINSRLEDYHYKLTFEPVGIVGAFTAWNFPPLLAARKIAPALAAGCSVVLRPSVEAPGIVMLLIECCRLSRVPKGVVNLVVGSIDDTYKVLINDHRVRKISVTGSTNVGKQIAKDSANTLKKVTMELGGNAPAIVFDDIDDIKDIAKKAALTKHANAGQVCASPDRFYIHQNIYDEFIQEYLKEVGKIKVGNCLVDKDVTMGPMVNAKRLKDVDLSVKKSVEDGAVLLAGGMKLGDSGFFYAPTVLKDVKDSSVCSCEENFGPVTSFASFTTEEEIISRANASEYGLTAYVFTQDKNRIKKLVDEIESGMIGVNTFMLASAQMPFGGIKQSGYGREGGKYTLMEYCNIKVAHYFK